MRKSLFIVGCLATVGMAQAGPTGLWMMPIADILAHREAFAYVGLGGTERNVSKGYYYFNAATVGIFDRAEIGYDNDFLGNTTYNIKVQLFDSPRGLEGTALSAGLINCTGAYREPYVVGRKDFKDFRLHAGYWNTQGCGRFVAGVDFALLKDWSASVEFMSGPSSITWGQVFIPLDSMLPGFGVSLAVGVPSARSEGIQHSALAMYSFKF